MVLTKAQQQLLTEHAWLPDAATSGMAVRRRCGPDAVAAAQLAMVGLAQRWDPSLGIPFRAYAWTRLRGAAIDHARDEARLLRRHQRLLGRVERAGHSHSDTDQAAEATGMDPALLAEARAAKHTSTVLHLDHPVPRSVDPDAPLTLGESSALAVQDTAEWQAVMDAVHRLPERQAQVIVACDLCGVPQGELAKLWGIHSTRVSQLRTEALARLRSALTA